MLSIETIELKDKHYNKDGSLNKRYTIVKKFLTESKRLENWFNDTTQIMYDLGYNVDVAYLPERLKKIFYKCFSPYKELKRPTESLVDIYEGDFGVVKLIDHPRIKPKDINFNNCIAFCDEHKNTPVARAHIGG